MTGGAADEEPVLTGRRARGTARTRSEILQAATREFARAGYDGARVEEIAARTRTTKRMIYYCFGGKEQLYTAVLEHAYGTLRDAGPHEDVGHLDPVAAMRHLTGAAFDHHERHSDLVRLAGAAGAHGAAGGPAPAGEAPGLDAIRRVLAAGRERGVFTAEVDAIDVHAVISSFCHYRVANRHTFTALFGRDIAADGRRAHYRAMLGDMVIAYLTAGS